MLFYMQNYIFIKIIVFNIIKLDIVLHNIILKGLVAMRKFKIPIPAHSTNKCIRFPDEVIEDVENSIRGTDCTFSAFVVEAVRVALENLREDEEEQAQTK